MEGTVSFCGKYCSVIEDENSIETAITDLTTSNKQKVLIISQTTYSIEKFQLIVDKIKNNENLKNININVINTICSATKQRQEETEKIAKQVDTMIIVGGKNSSNSNKLYELSKRYCNNVQFIETEQEITNLEKTKKVGLMAGASTPQEIITKVVEKLEKIC